MRNDCTMLYRQIKDIPIGLIVLPLSQIYLCFVMKEMLYLSGDEEADIIDN